MDAEPVCAVPFRVSRVRLAGAGPSDSWVRRGRATVDEKASGHGTAQGLLCPERVANPVGRSQLATVCLANATEPVHDDVFSQRVRTTRNLSSGSDRLFRTVRTSPGDLRQ